jgi:hypothetical protein
MICAYCDDIEVPLYPFGDVMLCSQCLNRLHQLDREIAVAVALIEREIERG